MRPGNQRGSPGVVPAFRTIAADGGFRALRRGFQSFPRQSSHSGGTVCTTRSSSLRGVPTVVFNGITPAQTGLPKSSSSSFAPVTPSHQYPTGRVMSLPRRLALIKRARQSGAWIIEDDYDSEFRRAGPAPPALFGLLPDAPVVYVGTFSKTLYPGLRLGYVVLPQAIAADFARATAQATRAGQGIEQRALADFIRLGYYTVHLRRMRVRYAARQAALRAALREAFGPCVELSGGEAGLHLVMWLPHGILDTEVAARAVELGLGGRALGSYTRAPMTCNGLVLGYGNLEEGMVSESVRRLVVAVRYQDTNLLGLPSNQ